MTVNNCRHLQRRSISETTLDRVRLAIIGCGTISQLNAPGYLEHDRCEVVALYDPITERAERRAVQWGITPRIHERFEDVLNDPNVDAVELLPPTHLHTEQIIAALDAGKHVSCQKPIASTVAEAKSIAQAGEKSDKTFRVTENFLYYPPIVKAKEMIDSGAVGDLSMVRIRTVWSNMESHQSYDSKDSYDVDDGALDWRMNANLNAGGLVFDDGWHKVSTAMWWAGDVDRVSAIISKTDNFMMEAPSAAMWKYTGKDCLAVFEYASAAEMPLRTKYYPGDEFMEIIGSKGVLWVTRCTGEMLDMPPLVFHHDGTTTSYQMPMDWKESFRGAAHDFVDSLIEERQPNMDIKFATKALQAILAIYEASDTERWVRPETMT
jgi:predicted dehydrogenase